MARPTPTATPAAAKPLSSHLKVARASPSSLPFANYYQVCSARSRKHPPPPWQGVDEKVARSKTDPRMLILTRHAAYLSTGGHGGGWGRHGHMTTSQEPPTVHSHPQRRGRVPVGAARSCCQMVGLCPESCEREREWEEGGEGNGRCACRPSPTGGRRPRGGICRRAA